MRRLERQELSQLVETRAASSGPCVSIYVPFGRERERPSTPRLAQRARELLERHYPETTRAFLEKLETFVSSHLPRLGDGGATGIALFKSASIEGYLPLVEAPSELAVVAESFHVRPILPLLQAQQTFYLLMLRRTAIDVLEGGPRSLEEVAAFRPASVLDDDVTSKSTRDFFKKVNESLPAAMARADAPVVLFGPPELQTLFREINGGHNPFIGGLSYGEAAATNRLELHARAWGLARAMTKRNTRHDLQMYDEAKVQGFGTDSLSTIAYAAANGRVKTLFLEKGVHLWGRVCRRSGALKLEMEPHQAAVDDILDDLAEMTLAAKGQVYVLPTGDMPTPATLCAILRPNLPGRSARLFSVEDVAARR